MASIHEGVEVQEDDAALATKILDEMAEDQCKKGEEFKQDLSVDAEMQDKRLLLGLIVFYVKKVWCEDLQTWTVKTLTFQAEKYVNLNMRSMLNDCTVAPGHCVLEFRQGDRQADFAAWRDGSGTRWICTLQHAIC